MSTPDAIMVQQTGDEADQQQSNSGDSKNLQSSDTKHKHPPSPTTSNDSAPAKRHKNNDYSATDASPSQPNHQPDDDATTFAAAAPQAASIFTPQLPAPLYLVNTPDRGRCVLSNLSVQPGTVLFRDAPIALIQFQKNKRRVIACSNCGGFIGTLAQQFNTLAATEGSTSSSILAAADEQLPAISQADQTLSSAVVRCPSGCTELYCSAHCQQSHYGAYHQLLCLGPLHEHHHPRLSYKEKKARKVQRRAEARAGIKKSPPTPPLLAFTRHALRHHQFFIMAAQVVARLTLMERRGEDVSVQLRALREYAQSEWIDTIDLNEGFDDEDAQKDNVGESETAHEEHNIAGEKKQQENDEESEDDDGYQPDDEDKQHDHEDDRRLAHRHLLLSHLTHVLTKSYHLLASALYTSVGLPTPHWLSVSFYSHLLGLLRMNNVAIELRSPLVEYVAACDGLVQQRSEGWSEVAAAIGGRTMRVLRERQREEEWEQQNMREEEQDDEEEEDEHGAAEASDDEESGDEEWSDSEDDESYRKEDEDSYQPMEFTWPVQQPSSAPTVVVVPAPISQPILSTVPLTGLALPTQQPLVVLSPPTATISGIGHSASSNFSFSSTLFPSYHGSGLYASIACLNHSCEPNVVVHFERDALPHVVAAGDGVKQGAECCMTYCDLDGVSREERHKELAGYGFVCDCERCETEQELDQDGAEMEDQQQASSSTAAAAQQQHSNSNSNRDGIILEVLGAD